MKSRFFTIVTPIMMLLVLLLGINPAVSAIPPVYNSVELTNRLKTGAYLQKTDNLMIIVDDQGESISGFGKSKKQKISRALVSNIGKTIPNIPHRRMLRVFGPDAERFEKDFSTTFGLYHIDAKGFTPIIATKTLAISAFDPLGMTFIAATKDLGKLNGAHAVVLISDGVNIPKSAIYESAFMKKKFGGSVCYYPIILGNDPQGAKNMSAIAKVGGCGFLAQYEAVDSPEELTNYVEKIFFTKRRLPVTAAPVVEPEPAPVQEPVMTDTEQVTEIIEEPVIPEIIDEEYPTIEPLADDNIIVLERQLPHDKVVTIELHVEFDLNKATLRADYKEEIKKVADFMLLYPETEALLEGHTCDLGSDAYNLQLSKRRAATVKEYLVKNFGISPERLKTRGAGEREPLVPNTNEEARMKNRRVMAVISTIVTDYVVVEQEILKSDFLRDDFVLPPVDELVEEMMQEEAAEAQESQLPAEEPAQPTSPEATDEDLSPPVEPVAPVETESLLQEEEAAPQDAPVTEETEPAMTPEVEGGEPEAMAAPEPPAEATQEAAPADEVTAVPSDETSLETEVSTEVTEAPSAEPAPAAAAPSDDMVIVPPGESAFDEEHPPTEAEQVEEPVIEPLAPSLLEPTPTKEAPKVTTAEDSLL